MLRVRVSLNCTTVRNDACRLSAAFRCQDEDFGDGQQGEEAVTGCRPDEVGERRAICRADGTWELQQDNCVLSVLNNLLLQVVVIPSP